MNLIKKIQRKIYKLSHPELGEILMLHRVVRLKSILEDNRSLEITPAFLEQTILKYQSKGYRFVSLDDIHEQISQKKKLKQKFVCFTFDDGYIDNYEVAYPILKKYNCPFTIFITTDFPDKKALLWWYVLEDFLLQNKRLILGDGSRYDCSTVELKNQVFQQVKQKIFSSQETNTKLFLEQLFKNYDFSFTSQINTTSLSWEQIKILSEDSLCTIASHTISHPVLTTLPDENITFELKKSKEIIESHINKSVEHFAFPYGIHNSKVTKIVENNGYITACLANGGLERNGDSSFILKRNILLEP